MYGEHAPEAAESAYDAAGQDDQEPHVDDVRSEQACDLLLGQDRDTALMYGLPRPKVPGLEEGLDLLGRLLEAPLELATRGRKAFLNLAPKRVSVHTAVFNANR
jgi:hypothetical protein